MQVPEHMHITASLTAGYRFLDGSLLEVTASGDYAITDASGKVLDHSIGTSANGGMVMGTQPNDYGDIADDLAAFLMHDASNDIPDDERIFSIEIGNWAMDHYDELSILANWREDKRLGEDSEASEGE